MFIKLNKVIIAQDLTGMILAPMLGAVFIPVSYLPPFGWEYIDFNAPIISDFKFLLKKDEKYEKHERGIVTKEGTIMPSLYYWEIERFYKMFLNFNSLIYNDFSFDSVVCDNKKLYFHSKSGLALTVQYDVCWVVNPGKHFYINKENEPDSVVESEAAHILYALKIRTDTPDAKGIQHQYDIEECSKFPITKIWYSSLFGKKKVKRGYDPKNKKETITTRDVVFFCENVPINDVENEEYQIYQIRKTIYNALIKHKRIADRIMSFEKDIKKFVLSTNLDLYKDTDSEKYIYFNEKSEIICQKNLEKPYLPRSSQRILHFTMNKIIGFLLINKLQKKTLF